MTNLTDLTEKAYDLLNQNIGYSQVIEYLQSDDLINISLALLNLEKIDNPEHLMLLINLLDSADSRIRELTSYVLNKFAIGHEYHIFFNKEKTINFLLNKITDKNPKVCKNIINILGIINNKQLVIKNTVDNLKDKDDTHSVYWHLEALSEVIDSLPAADMIWDDILDILDQDSSHEEYQIREKISYIIKKAEKIVLNNYRINNVKEKLVQDTNFYVRFALS